MRCVANYEIQSDVSAVKDDLILIISDPLGKFSARIKNIPRSEFTTPFLLSLHIYFDAPSLKESEEIADGHMADCLNMLAFTIGSGFRKHRIRQIANAEPSEKMSMRDVLMWGERVQFDDPQPFLKEENTKTIERLLEHDIPPAIRRALRWYRLGIDAASPDDQFTYFWFALEIVAEFQKPIAKVHDKCPRCQSPLYCEKCEEHPEHRPYPKQAIRSLMTLADKECDEATVNLLDKTRNSLMHGSTLKEIESNLPNPHEHVIDILGRILWKALIMQFPKHMFDGSLIMGVPSTYVHYKVNAVAHIQTAIPIDQDGHLDLDANGIIVAMKPSGPPQSALPFVVRMTKQQYERLRALSYRNGEQQEMLKRIQDQIKEEGGYILALIPATDMSVIRKAVQIKQEGEWQALFIEILEPKDAGGT